MKGLHTHRHTLIYAQTEKLVTLIPLCKALQVWSIPPALAISTAYHCYSFPAPNSPTVFFPLSLDRGPWVKRRGERSITTRSDPIKYRFN